MASTWRRFLWTAVAVLAAVGAGLWLVGPSGPGGLSGTGGEADTASRAEAPASTASGGPGDTVPGAEGGELGLPDLELAGGVDLAREFEPPATRQVHRYELFRDGRSVGSFRAEVARGQEGMIELWFRLQTPAGTEQGSVTTASRLFYRYARLAVEAETGSRLPLLTVLAPPALEAVLDAREASGAGEAGEGNGEPVEVGGASALRFSSAVEGGVRITTDVVPGRLLPLQVRTTLPDGTELRAAPPGTSP